MSLLLALTSGSAGAFTLTCTTGSYSLSGQSASLNRSKRIVANAGGYTYTGVTSNLLRSKRVIANAGSYTLTGQQANLTGSAEPIATPQVKGGISKSRLFVIEVDGTEYRVPQNKLQSFLDAIPKKVEEKKAQRKAPTERFKPVEFEIISAPVQFIEKLQTEPIYASLKANKLFLQATIRYQQELDDEEAILLLM